MRHVRDWLRDRIGCAGGQAGYAAVLAATRLRNRARPERRLGAAVTGRLAPLFPALDLERVRLIEHASLPANWLPRWVPGSVRIAAITLGYRIYFRERCEEAGPGLALLVHELVHVDQLRRRDDDVRRFACDYGRGYLAGGGYRQNPLEVEAYDFEHAFVRGQQRP